MSSKGLPFQLKINDGGRAKEIRRINELMFYNQHHQTENNQRGLYDYAAAPTRNDYINLVPLGHFKASNFPIASTKDNRMLAGITHSNIFIFIHC